MTLKKRLPLVLALALAGTVNAGVCQEILWRPLFDEAADALNRGDLQQAERQLGAALSTAEQFGKHDERLLMTIRALAKVNFAEGKYQDSLRLYQRALAVSESTGNEPKICTDLLNVGRVLSKMGKFTEAEAALNRAIDLSRKQKDNSDSLAALLTEQALVYRAMGAISKEEKVLLEALSLREKSLEESDPRVISALENVAHYYLVQSRLSESQALYKKAISLRQSHGATSDPALVKDLEHLGTVNQKQGKDSNALLFFKQAALLAEKLTAPDNVLVAEQLLVLGLFFVDEDQPAEAIAPLERALAITTKQLKENDPQIAVVLNALGRAYMGVDNYVASENAFKKAMTIDQQEKGQGEMKVANDLNNIGRLYLSQGKYVEAETAYKTALEKTIALHGEQHYDTATCINNLAFLYRNEGKFALAELLLKQGLTIRQKVFGDAHPMVAQNLINLGDVLAADSKYAEAEDALIKALQIDEKALGADHDHVALILRDLIEVLRAQSKVADAEKYARKLLARDQRTASGDNMVVATDLDLLAKLLVLNGATEEAKQFKQRANDIRNKLATADNQPNFDDQLASSGTCPSRPVTDKWALIIGVSSFQDPSLNLKYSAKDATDFRNFLVQQEHFQPSHIRLLTDEQATRANIVSLLGDGWLKRVATPDDLVVVYMSSHGSQSRKDIGGANFIVPYEGNLQNIVLTGIPMQWLTVGLKDLVHCDRLCVILDVCHGGAAAQASTSTTDVNESSVKVIERTFQIAAPQPSGDIAGRKNLSRVAEEAETTRSKVTSDDGDRIAAATGVLDQKGIVRDNGVDPKKPRLGSGEVVIAASQADQVSWESKRYPNGIFTRRLIEGLRNNGDSTTLTQAYDYLKDRVEEEVLRDRGELQTPVIVPRQSKTFEPQLACIPTHPRAAVQPNTVPPSNANASQSSGQKQPNKQSIIPNTRSIHK